ncbi:hypothetical protein Anapl_08305 [Anas platyrhynchos]|uniref:Uncharacterized protein n=1 Tax=Anas platyrhynchos TaxID=8839 RepID=R0LBN1_ANAPL|nr:hypothetical protein Anapl_08305 [Anas platyrhynchos]
MTSPSLLSKNSCFGAGLKEQQRVPRAKEPESPFTWFLEPQRCPPSPAVPASPSHPLVLAVFGGAVPALVSVLCFAQASPVKEVAVAKARTEQTEGFHHIALAALGPSPPPLLCHGHPQPLSSSFQPLGFLVGWGTTAAALRLLRLHWKKSRGQQLQHSNRTKQPPLGKAGCILHTSVVPKTFLAQQLRKVTRKIKHRRFATTSF